MRFTIQMRISYSFVEMCLSPPGCSFSSDCYLLPLFNSCVSPSSLPTWRSLGIGGYMFAAVSRRACRYVKGAFCQLPINLDFPTCDEYLFPVSLCRSLQLHTATAYFCLSTSTPVTGWRYHYKMPFWQSGGSVGISVCLLVFFGFNV